MHRVKSKIALWLVFKHGLHKHERDYERDSGGWNLLFLLLIVYFIWIKFIGTFDFQILVSELRAMTVHKTAMFEIKDWSSKLSKKSCCFAKPSYISDKILLQQLNANWDWNKNKDTISTWLAGYTYSIVQRVTWKICSSLVYNLNHLIIIIIIIIIMVRTETEIVQGN